MAILKIRDYPALRAILKKAFPGYRKHSVSVQVRESKTLNFGFWDGGSRSEYVGLDRYGNAFHVSYPTSPPHFGGGEPPEFKTGNGRAIANVGIFRGKAATMTLFIHPDDLPAFGLTIGQHGL